jgi:hypothetical protein
MNWVRDRGLTLAMLGFFALFAVGQVITGWHEYNNGRLEHCARPASLTEYFGTGHLWEAVFENWESEFLQMAAFVILTTRLTQKGSPESRRPGVIEPQDADPRRFRDAPGAPWPVRSGGLVLWLYERSLGLAFVVLFLGAWAGHAMGGFVEFREDQISHHHPAPPLAEYLVSARFWFESFQNWQSEFLAIGAMVYLSVYLRHRSSPESKPVHAAHDDNG